MSSLNNIEHIWSTITEVDTQAMRDQARASFRVAVLGHDPEALYWLADTLRTDPFSQTVLSLPQTLWAYQLPADQEIIDSASGFDLVLVVLPPKDSDDKAEVAVMQRITLANPQVPMIAVHLVEGLDLYVAPMAEANRYASASAQVDMTAEDPFARDLAPRLLSLFPDRHVALAHHLPGLRPAVVMRLIKETSVANAGYSASTGVAELVPVLFLPLNVADLIILSKNQALMSYKLALCLGQDIALQEMAVELAGVLGSGFIWRELARSLVGWVPGWGIVPKVAIAYAGTYVIGEAVFYWYAYRQQLTAERMKELYGEAMVEGKEKALELVPKQRPQLKLPALPRPALRRPSLRRQPQRCPNCQHKVGRKQQFCPSCDFSLIDPESASIDTDDFTSDHDDSRFKIED
ncbi:MAG: zinc ribbon domain-containing protein [Chloroflexi bacterium]|nr:zinc ribbon domain-containing protein [Chloroflexota bacterium]